LETGELGEYVYWHLQLFSCVKKLNQFWQSYPAHVRMYASARARAHIHTQMYNTS